MPALTETESIQEFEQLATELEIDFENYYEREDKLNQELSDMKLFRLFKNFLCKERSSPFSLDMPTDFAYGQWGI